MTTLLFIIFILAIAGAAICYQLGYWNWVKIKWVATSYFITCGVGINIYIIYSIVTSI